MSRRRSMPEGVVERHGKTCGRREGKRCTCEPRYVAYAPTGERGRKRYKVCATSAEAKHWRAQQLVAQKRERVAARAQKLAEAAEEFLRGARDGSITNRSGDAYKPSVVRSYEQSLRLHVLPDLGARSLDEITTSDLQRLAERLRGDMRSSSNVRNAFLPVRAIYRRAESLSTVNANPTRGLRLPAVRGKRDRVAPPAEAAALLAAVPESDRAIWATAFYGGLRYGELRALRVADVDFKRGVIHVRASWDEKEGPVAPKSVAGERRVPIPGILLVELERHLASASWDEGLLFGRTSTAPFGYMGLKGRARRGWAEADLEPITPHEARHTYASLMIAAGTPLKGSPSTWGTPASRSRSTVTATSSRARIKTLRVGLTTTCRRRLSRVNRERRGRCRPGGVADARQRDASSRGQPLPSPGGPAC